MTPPTLFIGDKNYSSWSLRPWLVLHWAGIAFEERLISLDQPGYGEGKIADVLEISPSGTVPVLHLPGDPGDRVWDSGSIAEWAAEQRPGAGLWPRAAASRAVARSVVCEMHSGFLGVRRDLPMNIHRRCQPQEWREDTRAGIARIVDLWSTLRRQHAAKGPWLFGTRTIADAFYAPVLTRFRTYAVDLPAELEQYSDTVLSDETFRRWEDEAVPNSMPRIDTLYV